MENNKKPEWFELADNDQPADRPMKKAPKRSLSLILAGVLVIPMGAGFALLSHDEHSAVASEGLNLIQDSPALGTSPSAQPSDAIAMPTSSRDEEGDDDEYRAPIFSNSASSAVPVVTPATVQSTQVSPTKAPAAITVPSANASKDLILPPTKKADDDEDHHEGKKNKKSERDHEDDDDDEEDDD
jgi:hypothetical protein